jgi:hypothetical protein
MWKGIDFAKRPHLVEFTSQWIPMLTPKMDVKKEEGKKPGGKRSETISIYQLRAALNGVISLVFSLFRDRMTGIAPRILTLSFWTKSMDPVGKPRPFDLADRRRLSDRSAARNSTSLRFKR